MRAGDFVPAVQLLRRPAGAAHVLAPSPVASAGTGRRPTYLRIVATPAWKERMSAQGFEAVYRNSADFTKFIDSEVARYQTIVTAANIKAE